MLATPILQPGALNSWTLYCLFLGGVFVLGVGRDQGLRQFNMPHAHERAHSNNHSSLYNHPHNSSLLQIGSPVRLHHPESCCEQDFSITPRLRLTLGVASYFRGDLMCALRFENAVVFGV